MVPEKTSIYEDAIALLERINTELKANRQLDTINSKMVSVVKDLNEVRIEEITGNTSKDERPGSN